MLVCQGYAHEGNDIARNTEHCMRRLLLAWTTVLIAFIGGCGWGGRNKVSREEFDELVKQLKRAGFIKL